MASPELVSRRDALLHTARLLGGAAAASTLATVLAACDRGSDAASAVAQSTSIRADQMALLASIADHIIPPSDTPGASAVGVPAFIAAILAASYSADDRAAFLRGLDDVDGRARRAARRGFLGSTPAQRLAVLTALDAETYARAPNAGAPKPRAGEARAAAQPGAGATPLPPELNAIPADTAAWIWGESHKAAPALTFWRTMKQLTLVGYYTSQPGATQELRYDPVPGGYDGCVPLAKIGRTWAV